MPKKKNAPRALLVDALQEKIRKKYVEAMSPGDRLPPQAEICAEFKVSPGTVVKAMQSLERAGLVTRQHGRGTFVADVDAPIIGLVFGQETCALVERYLPEFRAATGGAYQFRVYSNGPSFSHLDLLRDRVQGVVCQLNSDSAIQQLLSHGIAVVLTDASSNPDVGWVGKDSFRAGQYAAELLLDAGHTRIAYVGFQNYSDEKGHFVAELDSELQQAGVMAAMLDRDIEPDPDLFVRHRLAYRATRFKKTFSTQEIIKHFSRLSDPPTALISFGETSGQWLYQALAEVDLYVPDDLSLVTLGFLEDDSSMTLVGSSLVSAIQQGISQVQMRMRYDTGSSPSRALVDVSVVDRGTVLPPPAESPFKSLSFQ